MAHLKRLASCLLAVLLVITLIPGGVLTTAEAAANLEPEPVVNREDNVTLSKTAVQTAIDEWEVTLRISGGGATTVKPQIDIVLVTDYSSSMDKHVYGSGICGSTSFRADEKEKRICAVCGSEDIERKGSPFYRYYQCNDCGSRNITTRRIVNGWWCTDCWHYYEGEEKPDSCTQDVNEMDMGSRLEIAQKAQAALIDSLVAKGINARVGVVQFGGLSKQKLALTPILNEDGEVIQSNVTAIKNAINAGKMSGLDDNDIDHGYYDGTSGGTNIEAGLIQGNKTLYPSGDSGSGNQKFMILLSDGQPNVYKEDGSYSSRDGGDAADEAVKRATTIKNSHTTNFELYTVGFTTNVECLEDIASSSDKYYYAVGADLGGIFSGILDSILWVINNGTVVDVMGDKVDLITSEENISYSPTSLNPTGSLSNPVQPSVGVNGETIRWNTGSYVSGSAAMTYKVKLDPAVVTNADSTSIDVPLNNSAVLTYQNKDGKEQKLSFPIPTAVVEIGTLKVTSTGLPAGVTGTTQTVGNTLVGTAEFPQTPYTVEAPVEAPDGYELKKVVVNGTEMSKSDFDKAYLKEGTYRLDVKKGEQTVEYVYGPKSVDSVRIVKVDGNGNALEGAVFTVGGQEKAANQGSGKNSTEAMTFTYGVNYAVTEKTVPTTYNGIEDFIVTLKKDCTGLEFVGDAPEGVTINGLTIQVENIRKAQHSVIVHYVEQGTTNELASQATAATRYEDEAYDISSSALLNKDDIASWSRVGVRSEDTSKLSGTMGTADIHVYVEYARKAQHSVIVHYVEQGTTNELASQATAATKYEDEAYDISSSALLNKDDIASWSRVGVRSEDTSKLSGTMGTADIHVYVEYARKAQHSVTVYYWDVTDPENPVALSVNGKTSDSVSKYEDESYDVTDLTNISVANYQAPVVADGSASLKGIMGTQDLVINVNYARVNNLFYTVEHYYEGENAPFDTDKTENVLYGTEVTSVTDSDKLDAGYVRSRVDSLPQTIMDNNTVIKVYYDKISSLSYRIEYYYVGEESPFDIVTVENVIHGTIVEDVVDSDKLAKGFKRDHTDGLPVEITENGVVIRVYYAEKEAADIEIPVTHIYYTDKLDGLTVKDGSQPGASLVISVSEARETIVNLDEVGKLLTYNGNNYDFVSIRVIGTLKDEFKPPVNPGDEEITDSGEEAMEPETTTGDASSVDDETAVPTTTPDEGVIVPPVALEPTVEYTSDFPYQPEYDYAIELTYLRTETEPEPEPEPEPDPPHVIPDREDDDSSVPSTPTHTTNNLVTVLDPDTSLGNLPQTGGSGRWVAGTGLAGMLGAVLNLFRKKKNGQ